MSTDQRHSPMYQNQPTEGKSQDESSTLLPLPSPENIKRTRELDVIAPQIVPTAFKEASLCDREATDRKFYAPEEVGLMTDDLSSCEVTQKSDDDVERSACLQHLRRTCKLLFQCFSTIHGCIYPCKNVFYSICNVVLSMSNVLLFCVIVSNLITVVSNNTEIKTLSAFDRPCIEEWGEWSECSQKCRLNASEFPHRSRNRVSYYKPTGWFASNAPCKKRRVEVIPCNSFICPVNLSSYNFTEQCYPHDVNVRGRGCYRIRNVPAADQMITVDTELTMECTGCDKYCTSCNNM